MKLYTYIITRDFGFAPNPFYGICSLATCKPKIRQAAQIGDWIVGFGSNAHDSSYAGKIIYAFEIEKKITFNEYWQDPDYRKKRPLLSGSLKQCYGDNIYHEENGYYIQENSHHSLEDGKENIINKTRDLHSKYVLLGHNFYYWGTEAIDCETAYSLFIPKCRDYRCFNSKVYPQIETFIQWICTQGPPGIYGFPQMFKNSFIRYKGEKV